MCFSSLLTIHRVHVLSLLKLGVFINLHVLWQKRRSEGGCELMIFRRETGTFLETPIPIHIKTSRDPTFFQGPKHPCFGLRTWTQLEKQKQQQQDVCWRTYCTKVPNLKGTGSRNKSIAFLTYELFAFGPKHLTTNRFYIFPILGQRDNLFCNCRLHNFK